MFEYFLILKGNNKEFAKKEFEQLWSLYCGEEIDLICLQNVLFFFKSKKRVDEKNDIFKRVTFTNYFSVGLCFSKDVSELFLKVREFGFKDVENKSFLVRHKKAKSGLDISFSEKDGAKPIWDSMENPKVDVEKADVEFNYIFYENQDRFIFARKIFENNKDYAQRMPKLRPVKMPYTLKSDMARAAINLTNLKSGIVLDPFAGIGGILLEAYDMNFEVIGCDISYNDLKYFKRNFDYYFKGAKYFRILADSKTQFLKENTVDAIVTDIPYGRCCRKLGDDLYEGFLKSARKYLKPNKRLVIIYANFVEFKDLALKYFDQVCEISEYINKSMTRYILVLENKK